MPQPSSTISSGAMADPAQLSPHLQSDGTIHAIIETPRGSRNKFAYEMEQGIFRLNRILPAGMVFPLDFGFIPQTQAPDGDPSDLLVLMEEPAYPGVALPVRLIGILEGEQTEENGESSRNDRLLAVATASHDFAPIKTLDDLAPELLSNISDFFVNFDRIQGREYRALGWKGKDAAVAYVENTRVAPHK